MWVGLALPFAACCLVVGRAQETQNVIHTTSGDARGIIRSTTTGRVRAFLGIPFAEPPVGEHRFKKATPKKPWQGVLNATSLPPMCPQIPARINSYFAVTAVDPVSEDCLFLNVFAPVTNGSALRPVVVYIHGGAFTVGGIAMKIFDASELAVRGDLVAVTVAYRLGPLGFLNLGTEEAPGNMGLYDQQLALRWVKDNARSFGGDPDAITAMGQSAGAISIGIHLSSPSSAGLFQRAFMQSGSPFIRGFVSSQSQAGTRALLLTDYLDCKERDAHELSVPEVVACLRSKDVGDILRAAESFNIGGLDGFFPIIGGEFMPETPGKALKQAPPNARDVLVSVCASEGDFFIEHLLTNVNNIDSIDVVSKRNMEVLTKLLLGAIASFDTEPVFERYFGPVTAKKGVEVVRAASDLFGDFLFGCPALSMARALSAANASVHVLRYSEQLSFLDWPAWIRPTHSDDIVFSLGSALSLGGRPSEADVKATENMINVVSSFSRTGVPEVTGDTKWPKFDEMGQYLHIRNGSAIQEKHFLESTCDIWQNLLPDQ
ncbi:acetylcholinesterase-like [Dermacentor albipictus]|uniref:acetylcholinesterase-like n=1 Tax=Dermacentor albipictus TaxID=60249 RepID=UPI0031FC6FBC